MTVEKHGELPWPVQHRGEEVSNSLRRRLARVEPLALRTYTPSLAVIARSAGCYHWTPEGRMLADFTSGVLVANLGHHPSDWWRRVLNSLGLSHGDQTREFVPAVPLTAYNAATQLEIEAAERLVANLQGHPGGTRCQQVAWAASGSEAVQKALWAALRYREGGKEQAPIILATRHGFHGKKGLAGAVTGDEDDAERDARVRFISFPREECRSVAARRQPIDLRRYEQELEAAWRDYGAHTCCLITEPYLGGAGSYHPQPEYLRLLEQFCRQHEVLFILDEVQSNFGRTGQMYAFSTYGVEPDIVVLGKGLGNGIAVSAAVGRADVLAGLHYGEASDTWSANPLSSAAVLATLDLFETGDVLPRANALSKELAAGLERLTELPVVESVRGEGCVWGIECAGVGRHSADDVASSAVLACYLGDASGRAIHLLGPLAGRVLRISPPLVMAPNEAATYLTSMYRILESLGVQLTET